MPNKKTYIISLGGSLIVPNFGIDWKFLKKFRELILKEIKKEKKFFIVCGGGALARNYINSAEKITPLTDDDKDWLGIHSTRLNAHLLRTIFRKEAHPEVIKNPTIHLPVKEKIAVAGGWKPGWSTDYVATMIAQEYGVKTVINLSNIDSVYDKDPKKYKDARKIKKINWLDFRKIVGNKWTPGFSAPFDPIASQKGEQLGLRVVIMNGKKLNNLKKYFNEGKVSGTIIE